MNRLWSSALFGACLVASSACGAEAPQDVLKHWVGAWTGGVAGGSADAPTHFAATPDHAAAAWSLDNHFVQGTNADAAGNTVGVWMMRFDSATARYQVYFFTSNGSVSLWNGTWAEADSTMTWEARVDNGDVGLTGTTAFDGATQEWTLQALQDGKVVTRQGTLMRQ
jgi:hypothetical protein